MTATHEALLEKHFSTKWATRHAFLRCIERLGFTPTSDDFREMVMLIIAAVGNPDESNAASFVRMGNFETEVWELKLRDRDVYVVYDPEHACINTVLSPAFEHNEKSLEKMSDDDLVNSITTILMKIKCIKDDIETRRLTLYDPESKDLARNRRKYRQLVKEHNARQVAYKLLIPNYRSSATA